MSVIRCINFDWLEVYVLEPKDCPHDADFFRCRGWLVDERDYGTRVYRQMFTLVGNDGQPFLEVRRAPASTNSRNGGLFPENSCHIRLTNYTCYRSDAIFLLRDFLIQYNYTYVKIFRLDLCMDFTIFDKGDVPAKFVARYMAGRYTKVNQTNVSSHGSDLWSMRNWHSLSWGTPKSMVSTKLYCKTRELREVKDKPYIRYVWFQSGLVDDPLRLLKHKADGSTYQPEIWRLEFSLKSSAKHWIVLDGSYREVIPHHLSSYDSPTKLLMAFASLCSHYFRFKHYREGIRKDRCPDKVLFEFRAIDSLAKIERNASHKSHSSFERRLFVLLNQYRESTSNEAERQAIRVLCTALEDRINRDELALTSVDQVKLLRWLMSERSGKAECKPLGEHIRELTQLMIAYPDAF